MFNEKELLRKVVNECQDILAEYLPPDGISEKEAISRLLKILDNGNFVVIQKEIKHSESVCEHLAAAFSDICNLKD